VNQRGERGKERKGGAFALFGRTGKKKGELLESPGGRGGSKLLVEFESGGKRNHHGDDPVDPKGPGDSSRKRRAPPPKGGGLRR